ncbi:MAG: TetR/AcrR family transcriptional regulator [Solirubrobacterales bacterium]
MGGPTETAQAATPVAEGAGTRERILAHAVQIASTDGLEALTIGRLASELGMSKSGLFGHFGSKEELQLATIGAGAEIYARTVIMPAVEKPAGIERLGALAEGFITYLQESVFEGGCFWSSVSAEFDNRPGPVREKIHENIYQWVSILAQQAEKAGFEDPDQVAFELHAIGQGTNMQYQLFRDPAVFDRARVTMARIISR